MIVSRSVPPVTVFQHINGSSSLNIAYIASGADEQALGSAAATADRLYLQPIIASSRGPKLESLSVEVTVGAAGNVRIGLYRATSRTDVHPYSLLEESGSSSTSSTGMVTFTLSTPRRLDPSKLYYAACVFSATPTVRIVSANGVQNTLGWSPSGGGTRHVGLYVAHTFGALPNPVGACTLSTAGTFQPALFQIFSG